MSRGIGLGIKSRGGNRGVVTALIAQAVNFSGALNPRYQLCSLSEVFTFIPGECDFVVRFDSKVRVSIPHAKKDLWLQYH